MSPRAIDGLTFCSATLVTNQMSQLIPRAGTVKTNIGRVRIVLGSSNIILDCTEDSPSIYGMMTTSVTCLTGDAPYSDVVLSAKCNDVTRQSCHKIKCARV